MTCIRVWSNGRLQKGININGNQDAVKLYPQKIPCHSGKVYESAANALIHEAKQHGKQLKRKFLRSNFTRRSNWYHLFSYCQVRMTSTNNSKQQLDSVCPSCLTGRFTLLSPCPNLILLRRQERSEFSQLGESPRQTTRHTETQELQNLKCWQCLGITEIQVQKGGQKKIKEEEVKETQGLSCTANTRSCRLKFLSHTNGS